MAALARSPSRSSRRCLRCGVCGLLLSCSVPASRTPLGGRYDLPPTTKSADRSAPKQAQLAPSTRPGNSEPESVPSAPQAKAAPATTTSIVTSPARALLYRPLKVGDRIEGDVTLGFKADLSGSAPGLPAGGNLSMDSKLRVALKIVKASALALEQVELTVTTVSIHTELAGRGSDAKSEPPETYEVTLGPSPSIRGRAGAKPDSEERVLALVLVAPLADFHARWAAAPGLELEPGWSKRVPVTLPTFDDAHTDSVRVGPLAVRYSGSSARDSASGSVPFDLTLPVQYAAELGKLELDLSGQATLGTANGRPTSVELSGPFSAEGGRSAGPLSFSGRVKFAAQLSYL